MPTMNTGVVSALSARGPDDRRGASNAACVARMKSPCAARENGWRRASTAWPFCQWEKLTLRRPARAWSVARSKCAMMRCSGNPAPSASASTASRAASRSRSAAGAPSFPSSNPSFSAIPSQVSRISASPSGGTTAATSARASSRRPSISIAAARCPPVRRLPGRRRIRQQAERLRGVPLVDEEVGEVQPRRDAVGLPIKHGAQPGDRCRRLTTQTFQRGEVGVGEVVAGGDRQRPIQSHRGARHRAEAIKCGAVAHPGVGIVRPQPQAGLERGGRAAPVAAGNQSAGEREVGVGRIPARLWWRHVQRARPLPHPPGPVVRWRD